MSKKIEHLYIMVLNKRVKSFIKNHLFLKGIVRQLYNIIPFSNKVHVRRGNVVVNQGFLRKTSIFIHGEKNKVVIGKDSKLIDTNIMISGNNNNLVIGEGVIIVKGDFVIEDASGQINIGARTVVCGKTHLACIEGCKIEIGEECLFSSDIICRTGDSHSILECQSGKRINKSLNVKVGNHVWIGNNVTILKGVEISDSSVVGTGSIVTRQFDEKNVVIAGNPAKIISHGIDWCDNRI